MTDAQQTGTTSQTARETAASIAKRRRGPIIGAIFLMATSAIGPGFITQTATFTAQLGAAFAFAILISVLIDFAVQMNVWRMVTVTGKRAGDLANMAVPYAGHVLAVLIVIGGLAFNIGNIAGGGLGLNALFGIDPKLGGLITGLLAIGIFMFKKAGPVVDAVVLILGIGMIVLTVIVAVIASPPIGDALRQTFVPDEISFATITTIVGGTVGGYITYAGAHRYLDSGRTGVEHVKDVHRASVNGILVTGIMRYVLFLAILGVVASGVTLDLSSQAANPAGQAFGAALGDAGLRRHLLGRRDQLGHRRRLHVGDLPLDLLEAHLLGLGPAARDGRVHRGVAHRLPAHRHGAGRDPGVRGRLQRADPADRPVDLHVHRLVPLEGRAGRLPLPEVAARPRHARDAAELLHGRDLDRTDLRVPRHRRVMAS